MNDLDFLLTEVQDAHLDAPTKNKVYTIAGLKFGPGKAGQPVLIVRACTVKVEMSAKAEPRVGPHGRYNNEEQVARSTLVCE
jgi:hypothetical protein